MHLNKELLKIFYKIIFLQRYFKKYCLIQSKNYEFFLHTNLRLFMQKDLIPPSL